MASIPFTTICRDGYAIAGHVWSADSQRERGTVIVNAATGVLARYYYRYAEFLAELGYAVITYDYRGIGASRPRSLRGSAIRWRDWGELDFDAIVAFARARTSSGLLAIVGHSIGGFLPGLAASAPQIDRMLSVGAQYAYWPDYALARRAQLVLKWHVAMPAITAIVGYFPGRKLGWVEDLPAGVAYEWAARGKRYEASMRADERDAIVERFAAVRAPILAVGVSDDEFGTPRAIQRGLAYYVNAPRTYVELTPAELGVAAIGHFGLFHARFRDTFWRATARWLADG